MNFFFLFEKSEWYPLVKW